MGNYLEPGNKVMKRFSSVLAALAVLCMMPMVQVSAEDFDPEAAYGEIVRYYAHHLETEWKEYIYKCGLLSYSTITGNPYMDNNEIIGDVWRYISYYNAGYCYYDINGDGIEELLLGNYYDDSNIPKNYLDVFTYADGKPVHIMSSYPPGEGGGSTYYAVGKHEITRIINANMHADILGVEYYRLEGASILPVHRVMYGQNGDLYAQVAQGSEMSWDEIPKKTITTEEFWAEWSGKYDAAEAFHPPLIPMDGRSRDFPYTRAISVPVQGAFGYDALLSAIKNNMEQGNFSKGGSALTREGLSVGDIGYLWDYYFSTERNTPDTTGYVYLDLDNDGQKELAMGAIDEDGGLVIYDLYTITDGKIIHLVDGSERDNFSFGKDNTITEFLFGGAVHQIVYVYRLVDGALEITDQYEFIENTYGHLSSFGTADANWEISTEGYDAFEAAYEAQKATAPTATPFSQFTPSNITPGDLDGDGTVNAADAAAILIAAAKIGAGEPPGLTTEQENTADLDDDGSINAADAAIILQYAAAVGAGQSDAKITDFI